MLNIFPNDGREIDVLKKAEVDLLMIWSFDELARLNSGVKIANSGQ